MKLYHHPMSGCSRRVLAFLKAYSIDADLEVVALDKGAHKRPEFLALNPNGRVPVLVDNDFVLWESLAILHYLAARFAPETLGETEEERARVLQWSSWGIAQLGAALSALNAEAGLKRMRGQTPDEAMVAQLTADVIALLAMVEATLAKSGGFIAGPTATIADYVLAPNLLAASQLSKLELPEYDHLRAWVAHF